MVTKYTEEGVALQHEKGWGWVKSTDYDKLERKFEAFKILEIAKQENATLRAQNKKLVNFLLDPMMPEKDYPNQIRFNRDVYNILYDELLKEVK